MAHVHHFPISNQNQSISNLVIFEQNTKAIALLKTNQFQIWFFEPKAIALLFGQNWLNFISSLSILHFGQSKPINFKFGQNTKAFWLSKIPRLNMAHVHHFPICNQNQSISNLVIFEQNTKAIALLGQNGSISSLVNLQSKPINFKFGHF